MPNTNLIITNSPTPLPRPEARARQGRGAMRGRMVTEFHCFPVRFIESFKLKAC
jgi:hypothetical protein